MESLHDRLSLELDKLNDNIKATKTDYIQFEKNCRCDFRKHYVGRHLLLLIAYKQDVGKFLYKSKKGFHYRKECFLDELNATHRAPTLFTEELYFKLEKDLAKFVVERLADDLTTGELFDRSTNPLYNLKKSFEVEEKQNLLKIYSSVLD